MELKLLHKDDFGRVYDLDDPGPYYRGLLSSDYRMPDVLCAFLKRVQQRIAAVRGKDVAGLDVAMNQLMAVRFAQRFAGLHQQMDHALRG